MSLLPNSEEILNNSLYLEFGGPISSMILTPRVSITPPLSYCLHTYDALDPLSSQLLSVLLCALFLTHS